MREFKFTMGADPEFNFISPQNGRGEAQNAMRTFFPKNPKWEETGNGFKLVGKNVGSIGWDGASATGEVRPAPVKDPKEMVNNLKELFSETAKTIPLLEMSTLSFYAPVGGHIHFGITKEIKAKSGAIVAIHKKLSSFYLPIMLSENKLSLQIRIRNNYGKITDHHKDNCFRDPATGVDAYTYEFRTPSAEWLTTPKIAEATIAYLGVVYNEIINNPKNFKKCSDIVYKTDRQGEALQMLAMTEYESLSVLIFEKIKKYIKTFEGYKEYKKEIDYILNPAKVLADKKAVQYNISKGWGLTEKDTISKKFLVSDVLYKVKSENVDLDTVGKMTQMTYNTDVNVELFAKELANRCAVYGWKLKHNYFFYGLRKGMDKFLVANTGQEILMGAEEIVTAGDRSTIKTLLTRMRDRFANNFQMGNQQQIDYGTGEVMNADKKNIMVGIPYKLRMAKKTKTFLEIIHDIENGAYELKHLDKVPQNLNDGGKLYDLFNKKEIKEPVPAVTGISARNEGVVMEELQRMETVNAEDVMSAPVEMPEVNTLREMQEEQNRNIRNLDITLDRLIMDDGTEIPGQQWTRGMAN